MKKYIFKIVLIFAVVVGITFLMLNYLFFNSSTSRGSRAAGETMALSFNPATASLTTDLQEVTTIIKVKPSAVMTIRGYYFPVYFDKNKVQIKNLTYMMGNVSASLGQTNADLAKINADGYIVVQGEDQTLTGWVFGNTTGFVNVISIKFARKASGSSNLSINKDSVRFYKNATNGILSAITGSNNAFLTVNGGVPSVTPTPTPTPKAGTPTPTPIGGVNATLKLKLKFQGIGTKPTGALNKLKVRLKLYDENTETYTGSDAADFTADNNGIWSGNVVFNGVFTTHNYVLLVKGPYHIQKKVCVVKPTETAGGTYRCIKGSISFTKGDNNLDLSGIVLLAGDLPAQDGTISSYDTSLIRNNLGKTDSASVAKSDVNHDGIIDTQDYSLVIASLSIKNDEE